VISKILQNENEKCDSIKPKSIEQSLKEDLFRSLLDNIINMRHVLVKLVYAINWNFLESKVGSYYSTEGRPGISVQLIVGLHILKQMLQPIGR